MPGLWALYALNKPLLLRCLLWESKAQWTLSFEVLLISCLTPPSLPASDVGITNIFIKTGLIENWPASIGSSSTCLPVNDEDQEPYICTSPIKVCTI
jgi:hypothetical protein